MTLVTDSATPVSNRSFAKLPVAPLYAKAAAMLGLSGNLEDAADPERGLTQTRFAEMVGHSLKAVGRWVESGEVPWISADHAATTLGRWPIEIWWDDWLDVKGDFDDIVSGKYDAEIERDLDKVFGPRAEAVADETMAEDLAS